MAAPRTVESPIPSPGNTPGGAIDFPHSDRLERVAAILYQAASRGRSLEVSASTSSSPSLTTDQRQILDAIANAGTLKPEQLRVAAAVSRSTVTRSLRVLVQCGLLERTGRTHKAAYRISAAKQKNGEA